jgi:DNA-binding transcriptional LysR family regulator
MNVERLSLDQMRVLALVAETGSFSAAAKRLRRVQSAVSYAITTLEQQLELEVFDRQAYRPRLTAAGAALLEDVKAILARTDELHARARALSAGLEPELSLTVEVLFPIEAMASILRDFRETFPTVRLRLFAEALGAVAARVRDGSSQLGVAAGNMVPPGLRTIGLSHVTLIPVAAPSHPLASRVGVIPGTELRDHVQLVLTDRSNLSEGRDFDVYSANTWRIADLGTKHALLLAGLGFGTMPKAAVRSDIEAGRLKRIALEPHPPDGDPLEMVCVHRADQAIGPAGRWLIDRLRELPSLDCV